MTKASTARNARRLKKQQIAVAAKKRAAQMTPAEARKALADWARNGGDLKYLMDSGKVRYKQVPGGVIAVHPEARPVMIRDDESVDVIRPSE